MKPHQIVSSTLIRRNTVDGIKLLFMLFGIAFVLTVLAIAVSYKDDDDDSFY